MPKTKHTKTEQRNLVNRTFSLVRNGDSITNARKVIANEVGVSPNTLFVWQYSYKMKTPTVIKSKGLVKSNNLRTTTRIATKSSTNAIQGLELMKGQLGVVFTSLVNKDGEFTNSDATAISGVANVILGSCKQVISERKAMSTLTETEHSL